MPDIEIRFEAPRGCGYRKPGGMYLVSGDTAAICERLPIFLDVCPTCGRGVKFSRGWTWINPAEFLGPCPWVDECNHKISLSALCILNEVTRAGLLWIGEKYYKTPELFTKESATMGISRRIKSIPHDFKLGVTWVYLAHIKAIDGKEPGIFSIFKPQKIEYVVKGDESKEELERMEKRGITLVEVRKKQTELIQNDS